MTNAITGYQFWQYVRWDVPSLILVGLLVGYAWSLWATSRRVDFNFSEVYKDEAGKPSSGRVVQIGAWVISSWVIMQDMMDGVPTEALFWAYCFAWAGAKALEKWDGSVPFGKGK